MSLSDDIKDAGVIKRLKRAGDIAYRATEEMDEEDDLVSGDRTAILQAFIPLAYEALLARE